MDFNTKHTTRYKKQYSVIKRGVIDEEIIEIINVYTNKRAPNHGEDKNERIKERMRVFYKHSKGL